MRSFNNFSNAIYISVHFHMLIVFLGGVSCDINPAVTLASLVTGRISIEKAIMYIFIQCVGCLAGTSLLKVNHYFETVDRDITLSHYTCIGIL